MTTSVHRNSHKPRIPYGQKVQKQRAKTVRTPYEQRTNKARTPYGQVRTTSEHHTNTVRTLSEQNNGRAPYEHRTYEQARTTSKHRTDNGRTTSEHRTDNGRTTSEHRTNSVLAPYANPYANNGTRPSVFGGGVSYHGSGLGAVTAAT